MNGQEAIEVLKERIDAIEDDQAYSQMSKSMYKDGYRRMDAYRLAIKALCGPQPDPITGLVPCGCGGKVDVAFLPSRTSYPSWHGVPDMYLVNCFNCHVGTRPCQTAEQAKASWNTAMGWKGGAE